jgi:hypothetical protein
MELGGALWVGQDLGIIVSTWIGVRINHTPCVGDVLP